MSLPGFTKRANRRGNRYPVKLPNLVCNALVDISEMSLLSRFALNSFLAVLALLASAHAMAVDLRQCAAIDHDAARLACYDRLSGRASHEPDGVGTTDNQNVAASASSPAGGIGLTPMQKAWSIGESGADNFEIRPYRAVYLLPVFASSSVNSAPSSPTHQTVDLGETRSLEAKFQVSFKTKVASDLFGDNGDLWLAYTQASRWQVYSSEDSRPFRETNYEPEAIFVWKTNAHVAGFDVRFASLGINHQSNGKGGELSRSWNRLIAQVGLERGDWNATLRGWHRIRESASSDDNPDIEKYLGRGEIELARKVGNHLLMAQMHYPLSGASDSKGSLRADWAFPISRGLRGHVQWFSGYGESMIDYNHKANYIGLGISLVEPF